MEDKNTVMVHPKAVPDPEVPQRAVRRRFTPAYKLRILIVQGLNKLNHNCRDRRQVA